MLRTLNPNDSLRGAGGAKTAATNCARDVEEEDDDDFDDDEEDDAEVEKRIPHHK